MRLAISLLLLVAGCSAQLAGNATPSAAPENRMGEAARLTLAGAAGAAQGQRGAPQFVSGPVGSHPADRVAVPASGAPPLTPEVLAGGTTYSGIVNYAKPSHGRWYLAIPDGKGVLVRICGPAGCLDRVSTDAGPDLAMQRAGRIADLNSVDWAAISGVPLRFGGFQGTILILRRPAAIPLPQTDLEGP